MKNLVKSIGLITLIFFSFFYTDKVMMVVKEQDDIMIKLEEINDTYDVKKVDAIIEDNTIIPGLNGIKIDIDKSYQQMKQVGTFNTRLLKYKEISPTITINDNYDKYIIQGNHSKQMISLIFIIDDDKLLDKLTYVLNKQQIKANLFIDYNYLSKVKKLANFNLYSYGNHGEYSYDNILFSINLLEKNADNNANFCLALKENKNTLLTCSSQKMHTIIPNIMDKDNIYNDVKKNIENGSIIQINVTTKNINELNNIITFIKGKGFSIVSLDKLLSEKIN